MGNRSKSFETNYPVIRSYYIIVALQPKPLNVPQQFVGKFTGVGPFTTYAGSGQGFN